MTRLDNSQFLKQVETLTQSNNGKSSIYLTQKDYHHHYHQ